MTVTLFKSMSKKLALILVILFLLTGCSRSGLSAPTPIPADYLPTAVALTAESLASPIPAQPTATEAIPPTSTATLTQTPSPTPTATLTPTAGPIAPLPAIRILSPGPMSKVVSPIVLKSYVRPGAREQFQVELLGEDGRLLAREILRREVYLNEGAYINIDIPFETRAAAERGRLQISTKDKFGRSLEITSVHILLLSVGANDINPGDNEYARSSFFYPQPEDDVYGGVLPVIGEIQPFNDSPVILELVNEEGKILGLRTINMIAGEHDIFETTIPYNVDEATSARLTIRQADKGYSGAVYLHSQIVILNP